MRPFFRTLLIWLYLTLVDLIEFKATRTEENDHEGNQPFRP